MASFPHRSDTRVPGGDCAHPGAAPLSDLGRLARREMRRSDRTHTPLSLALFRVPVEGVAAKPQAARLWDVVCRNSRDTDVPCLADQGTVVVLLLDTDLGGAEVFLQKIGAHAQGLDLTAAIQQYPGPLFQNLLGGERHLQPTRHAAYRPPPATAAVKKLPGR